MPHDANGHKIKPGDHVMLKARVEEVYASETACNCRIKIDAPEGEPSAVLSQINTKSLYLLSHARLSDEEVAAHHGTEPPEKDPNDPMPDAPSVHCY